MLITFSSKWRIVLQTDSYNVNYCLEIMKIPKGKRSVSQTFGTFINISSRQEAILKTVQTSETVTRKDTIYKKFTYHPWANKKFQRIFKDFNITLAWFKHPLQIMSRLNLFLPPPVSHTWGQFCNLDTCMGWVTSPLFFNLTWKSYIS